MEGSTEINHEKHTRDFTDRMKRIVTKEYLEKVCKRYQAEWGYFGKREFVAVFSPTFVGGCDLEAMVHEARRRVCSGVGAC